MSVSSTVTIDRIQAYALSVRPPVGPVSSLGNMPVRNAVLVAITSTDGVTGWGEIWCNFPPRGNLARLNLLEDVIGPNLLGMQVTEYSQCRARLEIDIQRMAIHTGEFGPFAHCIAGIDTAMADLFARRSGKPLAQFLSDQAVSQVPTYASTPNVKDLDAAITEILDAGHTGIKLKIGLGLATDAELLGSVAKASGGRLEICADANQNWTVATAIETLSALSEHNISFIEEPLRADAPFADWAALSAAIDTPLAGGENITSHHTFASFMDQGHLRVVQPDVAKWGGVSGALEVGQSASKRGVICAIHYMGSGLGLAASIHTLAAIGGTGPVELDANPNPLRTQLGEIDLSVTQGKLSVPKGHGHGFIPEPDALKSMTVAAFDLS